MASPTPEATKETRSLLTQEQIAPLLLMEGPLIVSFVSNFPPILQLVAKIIELTYHLNIKSVGLQEKNKGLEYQSSGFNMETEVTKYPDQSHEATLTHPLYHALGQHGFTFKGISKQSLEYCYSICTDCFESITGITEPFTPEQTQQIAADPFMQILPEQGLLVKFALQSAVENSTSLTLNPFHKACFHAYATKWLEHLLNPNVVPDAYLKMELDNLSVRYESFLCSVLFHYFKITRG